MGKFGENVLLCAQIVHEPQSIKHEVIQQLLEENDLLVIRLAVCFLAIPRNT